MPPESTETQRGHSPTSLALNLHYYAVLLRPAVNLYFLLMQRRGWKQKYVMAGMPTW
jgi:hypothetical protein